MSDWNTEELSDLPKVTHEVLQNHKLTSRVPDQGFTIRPSTLLNKMVNDDETIYKYNQISAS